MSDLKKIMYGVTDFVRMREENAYFVDRTGLIPELEKSQYTMFLRPRRFGKSLLVAILQAYYDVDYADRFDELFGGLDIGRNPTPERGKYLFIDFNFTGVVPQLNRWPTIGYAAIVELKYFKQGDAVTSEALARVRADAKAQMAKYAKDNDLARQWNLKPIPGVTDGVAGGRVELKRILIVFHGGDVVVCDEMNEE